MAFRAAQKVTMLLHASDRVRWQCGPYSALVDFAEHVSVAVQYNRILDRVLHIADIPAATHHISPSFVGT